ncbi:MAG: S1C family serine protease [Lachnospiraceae bacterium]|nr:S1C family serine protease [Lachnospiraceae bacterium]
MENNENIENNEIKQAVTEEVQAIKTTDFMKETIKQRPINKRKLLRRLLITVTMAVVFGLVACVTFLLLEPVITSRINPEKEQETAVTNPVSFVEETVEEETKPEDMIVDETELAPVVIEQAPLDDEQIEKVLSEMEFGVNDYISISNSIIDLEKSIEPSIVSVVGITQDKDWINNEYENEDVSSGVIIADNGVDMLILTNLSLIEGSESYEVRFNDGTDYEANIKEYDKESGLAVMSVRKAVLKRSTFENISIIEMGTTLNRALMGSPVMAMGRPLGFEESMCIGNITSVSGQVNLPDASYKILTTDMFGSTSASGFLINLRGQLIGVIKMDPDREEMKNMISAYAISDIKKLIEAMSNGHEIPYLGIYGLDITEEISDENELPLGVYISSLNMDSPALGAGVRGGDIITAINAQPVLSEKNLSETLLELEPEQDITMTVMRQGLEGFTEMEFEFVLEHQP